MILNKKITFVDYFTSQAEHDKEYLHNVQKKLMEYGYAKANTPAQLKTNLISFSKQYEEKALTELAHLHPDKEWIVAVHEKEKENDGTPNCGGGCQEKKERQRYEKTSNFDSIADEVANKTKINTSDYMPMVVVSGFILVALALALNLTGKR